MYFSPCQFSLPLIWRLWLKLTAGTCCGSGLRVEGGVLSLDLLDISRLLRLPLVVPGLGIVRLGRSGRFGLTLGLRICFAGSRRCWLGRGCRFAIRVPSFFVLSGRRVRPGIWTRIGVSAAGVCALAFSVAAARSLALLPACGLAPGSWACRPAGDWASLAACSFRCCFLFGVGEAPSCCAIALAASASEQLTNIVIIFFILLLSRFDFVVIQRVSLNLRERLLVPAPHLPNDHSEHRGHLVAFWGPGLGRQLQRHEVRNGTVSRKASAEAK